MSSSLYRFIPSANADLEVIWERIAQENIEAADRTMHAIFEQVRILAQFPHAGHPRHDLALDPSILFSSVENYLILYRAKPKMIEVVAVLHAARDIPQILRHRKTPN